MSPTPPTSYATCSTVIATTPPAGGPADTEVAWVTELETVLTSRHEAYTGRAPGWLATELRARRIPTAGLGRRAAASVGTSGQRNEAGVRASDVRSALAAILTSETPTPGSNSQ